MTFAEVMEHVAQAFEAFGVGVLVVGLLWSLTLAAVTWRRTRQGARGYQVLRAAFGGTLLLGLEVLVAADLIRTIAVAPTLENVTVLGLIVLIRTFLSFSLQIEIEGGLPWRRAVTSGASDLARATSQAWQAPRADTAGGGQPADRP